MEAMEEDRIEFLKNNVWEYANMASATLLIQDEVLHKRLDDYCNLCINNVLRHSAVRIFVSN
jgi:hypothetical protein